jgi:hypothetical protein
MIEARCLCGAQVFELEGTLGLMHHCHCGYCRKSHGAAFATMVGVPAAGFRWAKRGPAGSFESSPGFAREFCAACGTPLPARPPGDRVFVPAGCLDGDPGVRPVAHIFAGSKASWFDIEDGLPSFEAYPPGFDAPVFESRAPLDPPGGVRGSCLCGDVHYVVEGAPIVARHCHCSRCRRARGAAHASNLVVPADAVRFIGGLEQLREYKVPEARLFTHTFCGRCGSSLPRIDRGRGIAIVPLGGLDDAPPIRPREHIWVGSKAPWYDIPGDLPRYEDAPPPP